MIFLYNALDNGWSIKKRSPKSISAIILLGKMISKLTKEIVISIKNRKINAVGLDTPSIDYGQSTHYGSHVILFEANIPAFENVANLDKLPATGATVFALPMKIKGGSGSPLRIIANF